MKLYCVIVPLIALMKLLKPRYSIVVKSSALSTQTFATTSLINSIKTFSQVTHCKWSDFVKKSIRKNITHRVSAVAFIADIREGKDVVVVWSKLSFVSSSISIENIELSSLIMLLMLSIHCPYPHIERPPF